MSTSRRGPAHPDFLTAHPQRRWTKSLPALFRVLVTEARQARGRRCWRVLWRGAAIAVRLRADFRLELRISRSKPPATVADEAAWERELTTFLEQFGCAGWERRDDPDAPGIAAIYVEPDRARPPPPEEQAATGDLFAEMDRRPPSAIAHGR